MLNSALWCYKALPNFRLKFTFCLFSAFKATYQTNIIFKALAVCLLINNNFKKVTRREKKSIKLHLILFKPSRTNNLVIWITVCATVCLTILQKKYTRILILIKGNFTLMNYLTVCNIFVNHWKLKIIFLYYDNFLIFMFCYFRWIQGFHTLSFYGQLRVR